MRITQTRHDRHRSGMAALEVLKLLPIKPLLCAVTALFSICLVFTDSALPSAPSPSVSSFDTLRREIIVLDRTKRIVKHELDRESRRESPNTETSRYVLYLNTRIRTLCAQAISIGGPSMVSDLPCPDTASLLPGYERPAAKGYEDRVRDMDRELLESLGDFDEMLATEQQKIQDRRPEAAGSAPGEPGGASISGRSTGSGMGLYGSNNNRQGTIRSTGTMGRKQERGKGHDAAGIGGMQGNGSNERGDHNRGTGSMPGTRASTSPSDSKDHTGPYGRVTGRSDTQQGTGSENGQAGTIGSTGGSSAAERNGSSIYEDDDIVARQLREAAEKETDPELKRKLWEEYRRYKESQR